MENCKIESIELKSIFSYDFWLSLEIIYSVERLLNYYGYNEKEIFNKFKQMTLKKLNQNSKDFFIGMLRRYANDDDGSDDDDDEDN